MMTWTIELIHAPYAYAAEPFSSAVGHVLTTQPHTSRIVAWCHKCRKESCSLFFRSS